MKLWFGEITIMKPEISYSNNKQLKVFTLLNRFTPVVLNLLECRTLYCMYSQHFPLQSSCMYIIYYGYGTP